VLDDFRTGYSSLGYLRKFEMIKIDRSFIDDLGEDGRGDAAIVAAIVGMARAQGYHLGRPLPAGGLEARFGRGLPSRL
jgi:EAL domain-containing protein (putative c-di-GMP-specific phosphodiesterase class I)